MVKAEFRYFSRGTDLQKLATAKRTNGFLADNQIWEAQGTWFSEIYVCKSPQGGRGGVHGARGLKAPEQLQSSARPICKSHTMTSTGREPATIRYELRHGRRLISKYAIRQARN